MNKILRNSLLLLLCLAISLSAFVGCKSKDKDNDNTSSNAQTSSDVTSTDDETPSSDIEDVSSEETAEDDLWEEDFDDDLLEEEEEEIYIDNATVKNGSNPIMTTYRGFGSIVHQMYEYMPYKNKQNEYTEEQAQEQFNRMQTIGITLFVVTGIPI